jgi:peroxiredoxin
MDGMPHPRRLAELEERFSELEPHIPDSPEKQALSILHGMVQELWRNIGNGDGVRAVTASPLADLDELLRNGPPMDGAAESLPLPLLSEAPDFTLADGSAQLRSLSDFRGRTVLLVFYPLDWSPTCTDQLGLYQGELDQLHEHGVELVAISVDSLYSHRVWAALRGLTFPLLADFEPKGEVARRYQVWRSGDGFSERALYLIDGNGLIQYAHVSPQLSHVPDIYELYRVLDELEGATQTAEVEVASHGVER